MTCSIIGRLHVAVQRIAVAHHVGSDRRPVTQGARLAAEYVAHLHAHIAVLRVEPLDTDAEGEELTVAPEIAGVEYGV